MELNTNTPTEMDLAFQIPKGGTYVWQIQEGIDKFFNENSGKTSLRIPIMIDQVVEGDPEAVGVVCSHFIPIETHFGEKQLATMLSITGLLEHFVGKFGRDVDPLSDGFLAELKLRLNGKFFQGTHEVRENQKGQKNVNFLKWSKVGAKKKKAEEKGNPSAGDQAAEGTGKEKESGW